MVTKFRLAASAAALAMCALALSAPLKADEPNVKAGVLTCNVDSGWGFIFGSSRSLRCVYSGAGAPENYVGKISKFGVDIGYLHSAVIVWAVLAPSNTLAPGALGGVYGGVTGGASAGVGAGANVLVGGSNKSISLQPVSFEGSQGLNVAAGIAELSLEQQK
jgi:hypothetical protein